MEIEIFSHSLLFLYIEAIVIPSLCKTQRAREFWDEIFLTRNVINSSKEQVEKVKAAEWWTQCRLRNYLFGLYKVEFYPDHGNNGSRAIVSDASPCHNSIATSSSSE